MKILGKVFSGIACSFLPVVLLGQQVEKADVITSITHEQETGIPYWQDIQTVSVNREEPRTAFMTYDTREDALTGEYEKSRFYKLLNGVWQFYYSDSHRKLPTERFKEAILKVVKLNERFIPPYETGASLYIRPLLIGTSAQVGVHPAEEYMFVVFVTPVGPYFKGGFSTNPYVIIREFDRAAPHGTGIYKVGGNYAASLRANKKAHDLGYSCEFYLDAKEKKYIDECGAANFFGIKDNTYITPKSSSILPSITNKSLMQLAEDMGIKVERRPIPEEELETFEEAGACGTAAVISPIQRIDDLENGKSYVISKDGKPGPVCTKLYNKLRGIQYGDEPDTHGWVTIVE